jgi:hypothetical protein
MGDHHGDHEDNREVAFVLGPEDVKEGAHDVARSSDKGGVTQDTGENTPHHNDETKEKQGYSSENWYEATCEKSNDC